MRTDEYTFEKLAQKLTTNCRKGSKSMLFPAAGSPDARSLSDLAFDYANRAIGTVFNSHSDQGVFRPWLCEIDFLGPISAGIRDFFPQEILAGVPDAVFSSIVMKAHDKAFEEQRYEHTLWKVMASSSLEKRQKNNATKAF